VGGIKEKALAAFRAGLRTVILPRRNEADIEDVPAEARRGLRVVLVDSADEVLPVALTAWHPRREERGADDGGAVAAPS
jgi:ATP-dependent Lon protease